jgi:GNAT superfamily N-acetyltransferase
MEVREVKNKKELEACFDLRYRVLREPWGQPRGSERDGFEDKSYQLAAFDKGKVVGTARVTKVTARTCKVNRVAVEDSHRKKGIGTAMMAHIESTAKGWGCRRVVLNSRENAVKFYEKLGYAKIRETERLFGIIRHFRMEKRI